MTPTFSVDYDLTSVDRIGAALANALRPGDVVTLHGPLGAGKTTLARAILHALGHRGDVPSPTFALVQQYDGGDMRLPVLHTDLYRLSGFSEIAELGLDEILEDGALLVEWPDRLGDWRWPGQLDLIIAGGEGQRRLTGRVPDAWTMRWPFP